MSMKKEKKRGFLENIAYVAILPWFVFIGIASWIVFIALVIIIRDVVSLLFGI